MTYDLVMIPQRYDNYLNDICLYRQGLTSSRHITAVSLCAVSQLIVIFICFQAKGVILLFSEYWTWLIRNIKSNLKFQFWNNRQFCSGEEDGMCQINIIFSISLKRIGFSQLRSLKTEKVYHKLKRKHCTQCDKERELQGKISNFVLRFRE